MLLAGQVQLIDQVPPESIDKLRAAGGVKISRIPSNFLLYLHLDQARAVSPYATDHAGNPIRNPLLDVRARRAISSAIDRRTITAKLLLDSAVPANQLLPSTFEGTLGDLPEIAFDGRAARQLLTAAGFPEGFRLTLHGTRGRYPKDAEVLQAIAGNLRQIGIDARAVSLPSNEFFARASGNADREPEFSAIQVGWASVEPSGALKGILATIDKDSGFGSSNRGRYSNKKVDEVLGRALEAVEPLARAELLRTATRLAIVEDQAITPLYFPTNTWASHSSVIYQPRVDSSTFPSDALPA